MATRLTRELVPSISLSGAPSQSTTLAEFASELQVNELRALRVDDPERGLEGSRWLCLIMGPAVQATDQAGGHLLAPTPSPPTATSGATTSS